MPHTGQNALPWGVPFALLPPDPANSKTPWQIHFTPGVPTETEVHYPLHI